LDWQNHANAGCHNSEKQLQQANVIGAWQFNFDLFAASNTKKISHIKLIYSINWSWFYQQ